MFKTLLAYSITASAGLLFAYGANTVPHIAPSFLGAGELGKQISEEESELICICTGGFLGITGDCVSPFGTAIDNTCDHIGCEQVAENDPFRILSDNGCGSGLGTRYFPNVFDYQVMFQSFDFDCSFKPKPDANMVCNHPVFCELREIDQERDCNLRHSNGMNGHECSNQPQGPNNPTLDRPGYCRHCEVKERLTPEDVLVIAGGTQKANEFNETEDCEQIDLPGILF